MVATSVKLVFYFRFLAEICRLHVHRDVELFTSTHNEALRQVKRGLYKITKLSNIFGGQERPIYTCIREVWVSNLCRDTGRDAISLGQDSFILRSFQFIIQLYTA
jgi:hypothetical protein